MLNIELTPEQVAKATGVSEGNIRRMCQEGRIAAKNIGKGPTMKYWRIPSAELEQVATVAADYALEATDRRRNGAAIARNARYDGLERRIKRIEDELGIEA